MNFRLFSTQSRMKEAVRCEKDKNFLCKSNAGFLFKENLEKFENLSHAERKSIRCRKIAYSLTSVFVHLYFASINPKNRLRHLFPFAPLQQTTGCFLVKTAPLFEIKRYFLRHALVAYVRHPFFPQRSRLRTAFAA